MAGLMCKCGQIMRNTMVPNDIEFWVYSDRQFETLLEDNKIVKADMADFFNYNIWRCPNCKRLYVFDEHDNPTEAKFVYKLEED